MRAPSNGMLKIHISLNRGGKHTKQQVYLKDVSTSQYGKLFHSELNQLQV